jgi:predicted glycosyltransferase
VVVVPVSARSRRRWTALRIWIDLANSPHPLLFAPIARGLAERGHDVALTARDCAQTVELALERWDRVEVIGGPSPKRPAAKCGRLAHRVHDLRAWARAERPEIALSHNSYAQIVAARSLGIRTVTAMDYEHQPANHLAFRLADRILLPEALRSSHVARQGARNGKVRWYRGLKEELYLGDFRPDPQSLARLGLKRGPPGAIVLARTPPSRALYHRGDNPLFVDAIVTAAGQPHVHCIVLPRHPEQHEQLEALGAPNILVPRAAVDALSVMHAADLVVGGGGTMTREAALLGVPTVSAFAGRRPAVDAWLEARGRLRRLHTVAELVPIVPRAEAPNGIGALRERSAELVGGFLDAILDGHEARA